DCDSNDRFNEFGGLARFRIEHNPRLSKEKNREREREKEKNNPKPLDIDEKLSLDMDERIATKSERLDDEDTAPLDRKSKTNSRSGSFFAPMEENIRIPSCAQTRKKDDNSILLFLKYFDVYHQSMSIVGSVVITKDALVVDVVQLIRKIANWSSEREVVLWEEEDCDSGKVQTLEENKQINDCQLVDGDIIVFQEKSTLLPLVHLPDAK
ncbi:ubiquitin hydrolase, partial [Reticulomyxa filosa]